MPTTEENAFEQVKAILGEHFQHYAIVTQDEERKRLARWRQ